MVMLVVMVKVIALAMVVGGGWHWFQDSIGLANKFIRIFM